MKTPTNATRFLIGTDKIITPVGLTTSASTVKDFRNFILHKFLICQIIWDGCRRHFLWCHGNDLLQRVSTVWTVFPVWLTNISTEATFLCLNRTGYFDATIACKKFSHFFSFVSSRSLELFCNNCTIVAV